MREILFRGKRIDNGEWVEGYYVNFNGSIRNDEDRHQIFQYDKTKSFTRSLIGGVWVCVHPKTVGQYTGLTDKNGKKIFEGDICKSIDGISLISWDEEMSAFVIRYFDFPPDTLTMDELLDDAEIIGNIHDNPELLKGEQR